VAPTETWGAAADEAPADLDAESAVVLTQAWRALIKGW
jgi:hypothetical protein